MKTHTVKKVLGNLSLAAIMVCTISVQSSERAEATTAVIEPSIEVNEVIKDKDSRADQFKYYYKNEDGHLWERKWNRTRGYWVTDWYIIA